MLKKTLISFALPVILLLAASAMDTAVKAQVKQNTRKGQPAHRSLDEGGIGNLEKMIVESGSVTMDLDLNGLNGNISLVARPVTLQFAVAANSFFPIVVFKDLLRGPEPGSMALIPENPISAGPSAAGCSALPMSLTGSLKQLAVEKLLSSEASDLAVRDSKSGFVFFN